MKNTYIVLLLVTALVSACAGRTTVIKANATPAIQAYGETPMELLVDIGIAPFDPGISDKEELEEDELTVPEVRRAESRYFAYHLKNTLELTGNWGSVRVTPEDTKVVDVLITGEIKESDGEQMKVRIRAVDSSGKVWIDKVYKDTASKFSFRNQQKEDPFQDFYNKISNDLLAFRQTLTGAELQHLRQISSLKFAVSLSPETFSDYMEKDSRGKVVIKGLPAENDPMLARVNKIKEREYMFIDTLDIYYAKFYFEMKLAYHDWREYTYDESVKLRQVQKSARNRILAGTALIVGGIVAGAKSGTYVGQTAGAVAVGAGAGAVKAGFTRRKQAEIHAASLRELTASLGAEITPIVLDIEGKTIELTGTVDQQYVEWRRLLRDIYAEETGLIEGE